jgi:hypothetical protein
MKHARKLYSLSCNNLPAGGMVGSTMLIYVDKFELDEIRKSAKRHKIAIESIEPEEPHLFSEVVNTFVHIGQRGTPK